MSALVADFQVRGNLPPILTRAHLVRDSAALNSGFNGTFTYGFTQPIFNVRGGAQRELLPTRSRMQ